MENSLGNRIKENYEDRTRYYLPRRTYTIIRLDGKAFHNYTKDLDKPYDLLFMKVMNETALFLCTKIQGAKLAYVQSDEISILVTDFEKITTAAWFGGNIQKIVSVSAGLASMEFNRLNLKQAFGGELPIEALKSKEIKEQQSIHICALLADCVQMGTFDSRVFTIPDPIEVENYFIWRQQDATRNSIQLAAQTYYSHKELDKKNTSILQEMLFQKGINWNNYPDGFKRGRWVIPESILISNTLRNKWVIEDAPIFTQDRELLSKKIPKYGEVST